MTLVRFAKGREKEREKGRETDRVKDRFLEFGFAKVSKASAAVSRLDFETASSIASRICFGLGLVFCMFNKIMADSMTAFS